MRDQAVRGAGKGIRRICAKCGKTWVTTPAFAKSQKYICPHCAGKLDRKAGGGNDN